MEEQEVSFLAIRDMVDKGVDKHGGEDQHIAYKSKGRYEGVYFCYHGNIKFSTQHPYFGGECSQCAEIKINSPPEIKCPKPVTIA